MRLCITFSGASLLKNSGVGLALADTPLWSVYFYIFNLCGFDYIYNSSLIAAYQKIVGTYFRRVQLLSVRLDDGRNK